MDGSSCPKCWTPITIPLAKALFAPYGISVDPWPNDRLDESTGGTR
jgi:hypothetical protein